MTTTANGQAATTEAPRTAAEHTAEAARWMFSAERIYTTSGPLDPMTVAEVTIEQKFAELHFLAATAADVAREADAEDRIASCVPDGLDSLSVSVRGQR